jgi:hypothetical protein
MKIKKKIARFPFNSSYISCVFLYGDLHIIKSIFERVISLFEIKKLHKKDMPTFFQLPTIICI